MKKIRKNKYLVYEKKDRGLLWSSQEMIKKLDFFLRGKEIPVGKMPSKEVKSLDDLVQWFRREGLEIAHVDVTIPELKREGLYVIKVLIPQLQPLYLDDRFPVWTGKRLKEVPRKLGFRPAKVINKFPHPFL